MEGKSEPLGAPFDGVGGYFDAIDWRQQQVAAGAAVAWLTPKVHVVDAEPTTALQRLASVVDCANGVGKVLDPDRFAFMNTDTVVHVHRLPDCDDFALRARASIGPDGIGVTTAEVFDRAGFIGTSAQTILVQRR